MDKTFWGAVFDANFRVRGQAGECGKSRHVGPLLDGVIGQRDTNSARFPSEIPALREAERSLDRVAQSPVLEIRLELLESDQPGNDGRSVEVLKPFDSEHVRVE